MASLSNGLARIIRQRILCLSLERFSPSPHLISKRHSSNFTKQHANVASTSQSGNSSCRGLLALSCIFSGIVGFTLAKTWETKKTGSIEKPRFGTQKDFEQAIQELKEAFPHAGAVSTDPEDLRVHGFSYYDYRPGRVHSVVFYPNSTEDVVRMVKTATKYRMPVIPYSGATSLEGQTRGHVIGGICVDMSGMDQILEIHEADSDLVCQPGAKWMDINDMLKEKGEVIKTRRRSRKSSAGFDTTKLFIGAEGTLGIVTEVTIRLAPVVPTAVAVVQFPDVKKATEAVIEVMNQGVGIQCVELLDDVFMAATNKFGMSKRKWPEKDSLFFKFQGISPASLRETARIVQKIVEKHGGTGFELARNEQEADELWADRKNAHYSGMSLLEGARGWPTDVWSEKSTCSVPISKLPELVYETKKDLAQVGITSTIAGHVGDGNFHALLLFRNDEEAKIVKAAVSRMVHRAIALDGTCTGEHGVGVGKKDFLIEELGEGTVELMKTVKRAIDPLGLFNPGKVIPMFLTIDSLADFDR
ncbi:hypothetical protein C0995_003798 [Termitomyces sp. Mi166|nr:hypothetical protein C0995_003798 [Termitomyces sp. Mi166\